MAEDTSNKARSQQMMTDIERAALITKDISQEKLLSEREYRGLLLEIKRRREAALEKVHEQKKAEAEKHGQEESEHHFETMEESAEGFSWALDEVSDVGSYDHATHVEHAVKGVESLGDKLGPIGSFIANGIGLLLTPWQCYRERRWPIRDEWIKLGLCAAIIICGAVALTAPLVAAGFVVAAATFGFFKSVQNIRIQKEELHRFQQLAHAGKDEIKRLNDEISQLEKNPDLGENRQNTLRQLKQQRITAVDQYVLDGYGIHRSKEELEHPVHSFLHKAYIATSAVTLIGVVTLIVFPPVGVGILIATGVAGVASLWVSAVSKWFVRRNDGRAEKNAPQIPKEQTSTESSEPSVVESHGLNHVHVREQMSHESTTEVMSSLKSSHEGEHAQHPSDSKEAIHVSSISTVSATMPHLLKDSVPNLKHYEKVDSLFKSELEAEKTQQLDAKAKIDTDDKEDKVDPSLKE